MAVPIKVARQQTTPELSGIFQTLPPEPTLSGTFRDLPERNLPEPTSKTYVYTGTLRNLPEPSRTCLRNLHHFTPEFSGTFWNLAPEPIQAYAGTFWNFLEPASGTYTSTRRNSPEPSGTFFRNLPPEPAPATHAGTYRSLAPLAYAIGEKIEERNFNLFQKKDWDQIYLKIYNYKNINWGCNSNFFCK